MLFRSAVLLLLFLLLGRAATAQVSAIDTAGSNVEILPGSKHLESRRLPNGTDVLVLTGNVALRQGSTTFYNDSCILDNAGKIFEAFGHVHINESDTSHVYSNHLKYLYDKKYAYLDGAVKLTDKQGTLTTNNLEYDVARKIGTYKGGGKVVNGKTVITSKEGIYYGDVKDSTLR